MRRAATSRELLAHPMLDPESHALAASGSKSATVFSPNFSESEEAMTHEASDPVKSKSHETRHRNTARRLHQALDRLLAGTSQHSSLEGLLSAHRCCAGTRGWAAVTRLMPNTPSSSTNWRPQIRVARQIIHPLQTETATLRALIGQLQEQKRLLATENAAPEAGDRRGEGGRPSGKKECEADTRPSSPSADGAPKSTEGI
ncbi:hypothetical protein NXC24_PA00266 (plasmid) [Rhizobium sp. NXC24]|nr:hypothetical protein NXC24_PA00266 [Rhizobium sp. NXC24]